MNGPDLKEIPTSCLCCSTHAVWEAFCGVSTGVVGCNHPKGWHKVHYPSYLWPYMFILGLDCPCDSPMNHMLLLSKVCRVQRFLCVVQLLCWRLEIVKVEVKLDVGLLHLWRLQWHHQCCLESRVIAERRVIARYVLQALTFVEKEHRQVWLGLLRLWKQCCSTIVDTCALSHVGSDWSHCEGKQPGLSCCNAPSLVDEFWVPGTVAANLQGRPLTLCPQLWWL